MILENKIKFKDKESFLEKLHQISNDLKIEAELFLLLMYCESELNPQAVNKQAPEIPGYKNKKLIKASGLPDAADASIRCAYRATGLIQFMPDTSLGLGTSNEAIYKMTATEQLKYVAKYFNACKGKIAAKHLTELYLFCFYPAALGKEDNYIFPDMVYQCNRGLDLNHDKKISIGEFRKYVLSRIPQEFRNLYY